MDSSTFEKFLRDSRQRLERKSDSEKVRYYIEWCNKNRVETNILRLSSESKGGWSKNFFLDFTTGRIIITKKSFVTKFADMGYVAGLAPYPYLLLKDSRSKEISKQASKAPEELVKGDDFSEFIWYSDIEQIGLRKGIETTVANMFGRAIVSNFLSLRTTGGKSYDFTLPANKNGSYEQISFWVGVALPPECRLQSDLTRL